MIEFTLSRVVLCVCGVALLAAAMGVFAGAEERVDSDLDGEAAARIADMLDRFEDSVLDTYVIEATDVLPTPDHVLTVGDHMVVLECDGRKAIAYTESDAEFVLDWFSGSHTLVREPSVAEGLGDVPDGVGEDVDLLGGVVDVGGGAGAAVDASGHV